MASSNAGGNPIARKNKAREAVLTWRDEEKVWPFRMRHSRPERNES